MGAIREPAVGRFSVEVDCTGQRLVPRDPKQIISEVE